MRTKIIKVFVVIGFLLLGSLAGSLIYDIKNPKNNSTIPVVMYTSNIEGRLL